MLFTLPIRRRSSRPHNRSPTTVVRFRHRRRREAPLSASASPAFPRACSSVVERPFRIRKALGSIPNSSIFLR
jgi:hypothetical protein